MSTKRQKQIEDTLEEMGFPSMADSLRFDASPADEHYYFLDLNRARRDNTEEEFPTSDYNKVVKLISEWFAIANKSKSNPRNSKMAIKRKNPMSAYKRKGANGKTMHFVNGKLVSKAEYDKVKNYRKKRTVSDVSKIGLKNNPKYTRSKNVRGVMMHRKDGKIISKEEFDKALKTKTAIVRAASSKTGLAERVTEAKKILTKKTMSAEDKKTVHKAIIVLEQAANLKANPKKSKARKARKNPQSDATKAMKLYHSGKAKSLKAAWKMVKR